MAFWSWSKTAATNATADTSINWAEGQSPSSVNDSARAMMARTAEWRDDISGNIATTGTGAAYVVASNQVFDSLAHMNQALICFIAHTTNTGACTLNVDGLGAKPLVSSQTVDLPAGSLISGTPYMATYRNDFGTPSFLLHGFYGNPYNIPVGGGMDYWGSTAPNSSFAFPVGQAISRTTYAALFAIVGTTYGAGDTSTTFNLPDKTGRSSVMKEATATRLTTAGGGVDGGTLGAVGGAQNGTILQANLPVATLTTTITDPGHSHVENLPMFGGGATWNNMNGSGNTGVTFVGPNTASATTGITASTALGGSGTAFKIVQPTIVCNYIMRII